MNDETSGMDRRLRSVVEAHVRAVLAECGGNKTKAAKVLDIDRKTMARFTKRWEAPREGKG